MPQRNSRKTYIEHGYYHVYNRGVEKRTIFESPQDYKVFLGYLRQYLTPATLNEQEANIVEVENGYQRKNYSGVIDLQAYALMPNHFHFLIRQVNADAMTEFIQSLSTRYSVYFNKRYDRVGSLFQGRYKAVMVKTDEQLIHLSRYIHLNPVDLGFAATRLTDFPYSSYASYIGRRNQTWLNASAILKIFGENKSNSPENLYARFVEDFANDQPEIISHIALD